VTRRCTKAWTTGCPPNPPGVPLLVPGQRIHDGHIEFLRKGLEAAMLVKGVSDPALEEVRVVA
jgi:arginine decarboxylase